MFHLAPTNRPGRQPSPACRRLPAWLLLAWLAPVGPAAAAAEINPPIGPYVNLDERHFTGVPSFTATNRLVLTPYFYWYDSYSQSHLLNGDGSDALTDHPPTLEDFSYRSKAWHETQLRDMIEAGIDVLLPVYWGEPSQRLADRPVSAQPWSFAGLPPLVAARQALVDEGLEPPRIGMFYDTSTLEYNQAGKQIDLTTPAGRQWFFESIRDFFSLIPPAHWALLEGKPVVFLYSAGFASQHDQACIDHLRTAFAETFGREPYIVREISWNVVTEQVYAWGGALGLKNPGVASLGPGYDHSAVPGRTPLVVDREDGAFFERNWIRFLRNPSNLVFIETWNEFHEGTEIAETQEYGRQYLELNRRYVDLFKRGFVPPRPRGPFSDAHQVSVDLAATNVSRGLYQLESADGVTAPAEVGESPCRSAEATEHGGRYVYFRIDDSFKWADRMLVDVAVEYFDHAEGEFTVEFDGSDPSAPFQGAYSRAARTIRLEASQQWKTARFRLAGCRFLNSQNAGADFRLALQAPVFHVRRVAVSRLGMPEEAGADLPGAQPDLGQPWQNEWRLAGEPEVVTQTPDGVLSVEAAGAEPACLSLRDPTIGGGDTTLLARLRVRRPELARRVAGGIVLADTAPANAQLRLEFLTAEPRGLRLRDLATGRSMVTAQPWLPNTWYWIRVRHSVNRVTGYPDAWARWWVADGESTEPAGWQLYLDYHPLRPAQTGHFGLLGPEGEGGRCESDFFFVVSTACPTVHVSVPAHKPAWVQLHPEPLDPRNPFGFLLEGAPNQTYAIELSEDFRAWEATELQTDSSGLAAWRTPTPAALPHAFYRARELDRSTPPSAATVGEGVGS